MNLRISRHRSDWWKRSFTGVTEWHLRVVMPINIINIIKRLRLPSGMGWIVYNHLLDQSPPLFHCKPKISHICVISINIFLIYNQESDDQSTYLDSSTCWLPFEVVWTAICILLPLLCGHDQLQARYQKRHEKSSHPGVLGIKTSVRENLGATHTSTHVDLYAFNIKLNF